MKKYTSGIWKANERGLIYSDNGEQHKWQMNNICQVYGTDLKNRKANAARIVQCVNSHDDLVKALKEVAQTLRNGGYTENEENGKLYATVSKTLKKATK